jgi:CHAT domain-containing protein
MRCLNTVAALLLTVGMPLGGVVSVVHAQQGPATARPKASKALSAELNAVWERAAELNRAGRFKEAEAILRPALAKATAAVSSEHPHVARGENNLAMALNGQGRYREAEPLGRHSLAVREREYGPSSLQVALSLSTLARSLEHMTGARTGEAEALLNRLAKVQEALHGKASVEQARALIRLGWLFDKVGRFAEGRRLFEQAGAMLLNGAGPDDPDYASSRIGLAKAYTRAGDQLKAEELLKATLAGLEGSGSGDTWQYIHALRALAWGLTYNGEVGEASGLLKRALAMAERRYGSDHNQTLLTLQLLASSLSQTARREEADALFQRALEGRQRTSGAEHAVTANTLLAYSRHLQRGGDLPAALAAAQRALDIYAKISPGTRLEASALHQLGLIHLARDRPGEAEAALRAALDVLKRVVGERHFLRAASLARLAEALEVQGRHDQAFAAYREAASILATAADRKARQEEERGSYAGVISFRRRVMSGFALAAFRQQEAGKGERAALAAEAFEAVQRGERPAAATAVGQMALRFAAGDDALSALVRQSQDLAEQWREADGQLGAALAASKAEVPDAERAALRAELKRLDGEMAATAARLQREFPQYAQLTSGKPLAVSEAQGLLGPGEALLVYHVEEAETLVWGLTAERVEWHRIKVSQAELEAEVGRLRRSLDIAELGKAGAEPFSLEAAHQLYRRLLGPLEPLVGPARQLLLVPSGPLTALPFNVLVTAPPKEAVPASPAGYRTADWLIRRQGLAVLPSAASLRSLRAVAKPAPAAKPLIGFADPVFALKVAATPARPAPAPTGKGAVRSIAFAKAFKGAGVDLRALSESLVALPETADELKAVAASLGAAADDVVVGEAASERTVRSRDLAAYRVVYFATHGLVAGEVEELAGPAEPALALTVPAEASEADDGLLTASEVARLKLNADWVVLSGCNTAAGGKPGAEALSGLARSFFYAGARALLVTHWPVYSSAAVQLTTQTFEALKREPRLGRAEALRRAMLALMDDAGDPLNAYPAVWAPFVLVGDGRS